MAKSSFTIINDGILRGIIAPARLVSKGTFEDLIDVIELSRPESIRRTEQRVKEADRKNSWVPSRVVEQRLKARLKARK